MVWSLKKTYVIKLGYIYNDFIVNLLPKHSGFICQESLLDKQKSQIWWNSWFEKFLQVDSYSTFAVFYAQYKSKKIFQ